MRISKRASRPRITINQYGLVELVWPHGLSQRLVSSMLKQHQQWVLQQLTRLDHKEVLPVLPPKQIHLHAIDQSWSLDYQAQTAKRLSYAEDDTVLNILGDMQEKEAVRQLLCAWVKEKGTQYLKPWLLEEAQLMGLEYASVSIRLQKKRWGSCSAKQCINLNASLLFLPDFLVRHVLIHELTHLKHLNHSACFWAEVEKFDKDYISNRKQLHYYAKDVPAWLTEPFAADECT